MKTKEQLEELYRVLREHWIKEFAAFDFPLGRIYEVLTLMLWEREERFVRNRVDHLDSGALKQLMAYIGDVAEARLKTDARLAALQNGGCDEQPRVVKGENRRVANRK